MPNSQDYKIILPTVPSGVMNVNSVILDSEVSGRPYSVTDFQAGL